MKDIFCKGQTGLYKVVSGSLDFANKKKLNLKLNFKINEVPQIINHLTANNRKF